MLNSVDYLSQMQAEMLRLLPTRSNQEKRAFSALTPDEQTWRFMNWLSRRVHPHPRQLNIAKSFFDLSIVQENLINVGALFDKIINGVDINPHLSEDLREGYCLHVNGRKHGRDFDMLLNEWGIHHLHLSCERGKNGFNRRTKNLLYVIFLPGKAFALMLAPHNAWPARQLIQLTVRSWPEYRLFCSLNVLSGRDFTEDEHKGLRKAGVNVAASVDGKQWISGVTCGITSALVSVRVSRDSNRLLRCLRQATEHPEHLEKQLIANANANSVTWPSYPVINVRCFNAADRYCFGFIEEKSGAFVLI